MELFMKVIIYLTMVYKLKHNLRKITIKQIYYLIYYFRKILIIIMKRFQNNHIIIAINKYKQLHPLCRECSASW